MTVANNPNLKVNRHPWNRNPSAARVHVEGFLAAADRTLNEAPEPEGLTISRHATRLVLAWLRTRLDTPPGH